MEIVAAFLTGLLLGVLVMRLKMDSNARGQEHMNQEESKRLCDELLPQPEQILAQCKMEAAAHDMLAALLLVREIVTVAALTGFNCHEGDWAARLYASQAVTHKAVTKAGASGRTQ